jgi:hypothetical protein
MDHTINFDSINIEMIHHIDDFNNYYLQQIYNEINDKLGTKLIIDFLENMIYINFNLEHIIDFATVNIIFDDITNEYLITLSLYNVKNKKFKSLGQRITNIKDNSNNIINSLIKIYDYITFDYLFIYFA